VCFFPGGAGAWAAPVERGSGGGGGRHNTELRSAWENVKQLLWPLLSACQSRSVDLELQLKDVMMVIQDWLSGEQFKADSMLSRTMMMM